MILSIWYIILIIIFLAIAIQDILYRKIFVFYPLLLFVILLIINQQSIGVTWQDVMLNFLFIILNFAGLFIYFSLKNRKFHNPLDQEIGMGDLLLFFAVVPLCPFYNFMQYFIIGLVFSVLIHFVVLLFKPKNLTVPLAGYLSIFSSIYILTPDFSTIPTLTQIFING